MYIGLHVIEHIFSSYKTHLCFSDNTHCLTGWTKLSSAPRPYGSHTLYVTEYESGLKNISDSSDIHILCICKEDMEIASIASEFSGDTSFLFVASDDSNAIYALLQQYFNKQSGVAMYGQTLLELLSISSSIQDAIEYSYQVFSNPIFVFDTNNNLIAATWDAIKELGVTADFLKNKAFSENDYKMANKNHFHDRVIKSDIPMKKYNEDLGYDQLICSINTQKNLGHIVISAVHKPLEPIDTELLMMLKKFISQLLSNDSFTRNSQGFNYEYFLKDLLDEKIKVDQVFSERTKYITEVFSGNLYCLVVETARSINMINTNMVRSMLETRFPNSKVIIYKGQIVCLLIMADNQLLSNEYRILAEKLCKEYGIFAGLSNCFQNILEVSEFYNQALRSIELGILHSNEPGLFCYDDYYMDHLISNFLQKHRAHAFCHPKIKFLIDYDRSHKTELAYTFYMYLINERNLAAAADAMQMHRTSLVYRFKKISSLIGEDYSDYKERMYMIISYEMNK